MGKIPFTQYLLPNGQQKDVFIEIEDIVFQNAAGLIEKGYRFECEVLTNGHVSLTCVDKNDEGDIAIVLCENGPGIPAAVAKLVKQAAEYDKTGVISGD